MEGVADIWQVRNMYRTLLGNLKERDLGIDERIMDIKEISRGLDSTSSCGERVFVERVLNFGLHKYRELLDHLSEYQLLKKDCPS